MTDTAKSAREIIAIAHAYEQYGFAWEDYKPEIREAALVHADAIITKLKEKGLEIRPIAPAEGKDVGEEELVESLARQDYEWVYAKCDYAPSWDSVGEGSRNVYRRTARRTLEFIAPRLIQQGLREAAGAFSRAFEEDIRCGWDVAPERLLDFENDLARRAEMQDLRANNRRLIDEPYMSRQTARAEAMEKGEA